MTTRRAMTVLTIVALLVPAAGTAIAANGGRVELEPVKRVHDSRPGGSRRTHVEIGSGVLTVWTVDPAGAGTAVIHPCGEDAPMDEATFVLEPFDEDGSKTTSKFATIATAEDVCLTSTTPVHVIIDRHGDVSEVPAIGQSQYIPLSVPIEVWNAPTPQDGYEIRIPRPDALADGASAAILSIEALDVGEPGFLQAYACGSPPGGVNLAYSHSRVANVAFVPLGPDDDICVSVSRRVHVRLRLLGELAPEGPDPARLPPSWRYVPGEVPAPSLRSIVPERVLDTRIGVGRPGSSKVAPTEVVELDFGDLVSSQTTSVVLNVTVNQTETSGHVSAWPCGGDRPLVSNLNFGPGDTVPNLVVVKLGPGGTVCLASSGRTHLIADVNGTFERDGGLQAQPVTPERILDTRERIGTPSTTKVAGGSIFSLPIAGRSAPATAGAATVNVTAVGPEQPGHATVYPCDQPRPTASNLNYEAGQTIANLVTAKLSAAGRICIYTTATTHLVVDISAWYGLEQAAGLVELAPERFLDTREALGVPGTSKVPAGSFVTLRVGGIGEVPHDADAVVMNITAAGPGAAGHVTAWPCDKIMPTVSNLNYRAFETTPNLSTVQLSAAGTVCIYTHATAHLVADVSGYITDQKVTGRKLALQ